MDEYRKLLNYFASCGLYKYEDIGESYREKYIDNILKEEKISIEQFNKDLVEENNRIMEGLKMEMREYYLGLMDSATIKEMSKNEYYLDLKESDTWFSKHAMSYEEAEKCLKQYKRKMELQADGFSAIYDTALVDGIDNRKSNILQKIVDGVTISVFKQDNRIDIIGFKMINKKTYVCRAYVDNIIDITDEVIEKIVKSTKDRVEMENN